MLQQLANGLHVFVRSFFEQAALQRAMQIEHRAIGDGVVADQHIPLENLFRDHVRGPADEAVDHEPFAVRCRDRAARSAEVDADVKDFRGHRYVPFLAYSLIPWKSASAMCCRYAGSRSIAASRSFDKHPTSARIAGMSVATSTTNGARLTPQFSTPLSTACKFVKSCCCTDAASRFDSSRLTSAYTRSNSLRRSAS